MMGGEDPSCCSAKPSSRRSAREQLLGRWRVWSHIRKSEIAACQFWAQLVLSCPRMRSERSRFGEGPRLVPNIVWLGQVSLPGLRLHACRTPTPTGRVNNSVRVRRSARLSPSTTTSSAQTGAYRAWCASIIMHTRDTTSSGIVIHSITVNIHTKFNATIGDDNRRIKLHTSRPSWLQQLLWDHCGH